MNKQPANMLRPRWPLYFAVIVVAYVGVAGITTVFSMLSLMYRQFGDPLRVGWAVSAYFLVSAISAAVCGRFGDLLGRKRITLIILPIAGVGAMISALSTSLDGVIAGCAIQGVTGALVPLCLGICRESLPPREVPLAVGIVSASSVAGGGISFVIAGFVIDRLSWTGGFWMKVFLALLGIAAVIAFVPDKRRPDNVLGKVNVAVGVLFAPAIAGLFIAFQLAQSRGWSDYVVIATLIAAVATLIFWGWHQTRQAFPLIQVRSLGERQILLANICICLLALGCMQNGQVISLFLQQPLWTHTGFGFPATMSGALMFAVLSIALIASPMSGAIAARHGARRAALLGFGFGAAGWMLNALHHDTLWLFVAACMFGSVCVAVVQPAVFNLVIEATGEERTSEAIGLCNVVLSISIAVGSQLLSALLASSTVNNPAYGAGNYPSDGAYSVTFAYIALMSVLGFVTALSISRRRSRV